MKFKLFTNEGEKVLNQVTPKTTSEIIQEIHESFYTEVDKLLADAKILKSLDTNKQELLTKRNRLVALGFTSTKECSEANEELKRLEILKAENAVKNNISKAIEYFSVKYPNYKFITEDSVKKICEKYGLIYGTIDKYNGSVPDKNLKHIEDFKIDENDAAFEIITRSIYGLEDNKIVSKRIKDLEENKYSKENYHFRMHRYSYFTKSLLEIAAPIKDFNMEKHEVKDFKISKIEVPDPVVLCPVMFNDSKYYLIVTAWGDEASDELVVNQKMN